MVLTLRRTCMIVVCLCRLRLDFPQLSFLMSASCWEVFLLNKQQLCSLHLLWIRLWIFLNGQPCNVCWPSSPLRSAFRLLTEVRLVSRPFGKRPGLCLCGSVIVYLGAHVCGPAGVSTVQECETKGERSLTDGGFVPMTQFIEECCTEREKKDRGGGGSSVFSWPCAEHMFAFDSGNTEDFSKQACRFRTQLGLMTSLT